jgi:hypothetical protein
MKIVIELIAFLNTILRENSQNKIKLIKIFQERIWNDETIQDEKLNDILTDIAYILDFYEPNEVWRKESPNFYGDEKLKEVIEIAIQKLDKVL